MKKSVLILGTVASLALVTACSPGEDRNAVDQTQDAVAGAVGQVSATTMGSNMISAYVPNAARGDLYEVQAAAVALQKSTNDEVKALARMIDSDHKAATENLKTAVASLNESQTVPTDLDERRKGMIDNLNTAPAADFDRVYLQQQVAAHEEALTLHRGFADNTDAPALAEHARTVVPKIEAHLEKARQLLASQTDTATTN